MTLKILWKYFLLYFMNSISNMINATTTTNPAICKTSIWNSYSTIADIRKNGKLLINKSYSQLPCQSALSQNRIQPVSVVGFNRNTIVNLFRGSALRIASDMSSGIALENIKIRVMVGKENMFQATKEILKESGIAGLWSGTGSRTIEGALVGALYLAGSITTKKYMMNAGFSKSMSALMGGLVGGVSQAVIMTPAGMVFTALNIQKNSNVNKDENDSAFSITKRLIKEKGLLGMYCGCLPMVMRQATNWASRSAFTQIAREQFHLYKYGILGEIGSGFLGGIGSCWNTPIETVRVLVQRDVAAGLPKKPAFQYATEILEDEGVPGLFRGVTPRALLAMWETVFMVVFPNMLGF